MAKTLVCIIAQTRSHEVTWKNFEKNVLRELNADLALCIGLTKKYNFENPFWKNAKYKWTIEDFGDDYSKGFDLAQQKIFENSKEKKEDWRILLNIKDFWLGGIKGYTSGDKSHLSSFPNWSKDRVGSSSILIFYRWLLLQNLEENNLIEKYDRFIVTRSDYFWPIKHPSVDKMKKEYIWIPDDEGFGGVTDRYVLTNKSDIKAYLSILNPILTEPKRLYNLMKNKKNWNLEKYIKLYFEQKKIKKRIKFFPYFMYTVFPNPKTTKEFDEFTDLNLEWMRTVYSSNKISNKLNLIIKKPSEYLSSTIYKSIIKDHNSWKNLKILKIKYLFLALILFLDKKILIRYFFKNENIIDWEIIEKELEGLRKKGGFLNYIKNKHYI